MERIESPNTKRKLGIQVIVILHRSVISSDQFQEIIAVSECERCLRGVGIFSDNRNNVCQQHVQDW